MILINLAFNIVDRTVVYVASEWYLSHIPIVNQNIFLSSCLVDSATLNKLNGGDPLEWSFKFMTGLEHTKNLVNESENRLYRNQIVVMSKVINHINWLRRKHQKNIIDQDHVYTMKKRQAEMYMQNPNIDSSVIPLVKSYSDSHDCSMDAAAKVILLASNEYESILVQTEVMRENFMKTLKKCATAGEVDAAYVDFRKKYYFPR
jgi:hypothetical protein